MTTVDFYIGLYGKEHWSVWTPQFWSVSVVAECGNYTKSWSTTFIAIVKREAEIYAVTYALERLKEREETRVRVFSEFPWKSVNSARSDWAGVVLGGYEEARRLIAQFEDVAFYQEDEPTLVPSLMKARDLAFQEWIQNQEIKEIVPVQEEDVFC